MFVEQFTSALLLVIVLSAIPLGASLIVGLVISILQAATQIQEMTLTFVPKLIAVVAVLFLFGGWMVQEMIEFCVVMLKVPRG